MSLELHCASRELEEETGYRSENLEWLINLRTTVAFCNEKIEVFVAKESDSFKAASWMKMSLSIWVLIRWRS